MCIAKTDFRKAVIGECRKLARSCTSHKLITFRQAVVETLPWPLYAAHLKADVGDVQCATRCSHSRFQKADVQTSNNQVPVFVLWFEFQPPLETQIFQLLPLLFEQMCQQTLPGLAMQQRRKVHQLRL